MTTSKSLLTLTVLTLLLLFGCSNEKNVKETPTIKTEKPVYELIASEKTLPANFHEIAFERSTTPLHQYLVRKVENQAAFEETWNLYELKDNIPNNNFSETSILFIGAQESGSCPTQLKDVKLSPSKNTIKVTLSEPDIPCTSDGTPRTFVISVDKEVFKDLESVIIAESEVETNIPFEN